MSIEKKLAREGYLPEQIPVIAKRVRGNPPNILAKYKKLDAELSRLLREKSKSDPFSNHYKVLAENARLVAKDMDQLESTPTVKAYMVERYRSRKNPPRRIKKDPTYFIYLEDERGAKNLYDTCRNKKVAMVMARRMQQMGNRVRVMVDP